MVVDHTCSSSPQQCDCCPYGYHIDLGFVKFAEDIAAGKEQIQAHFNFIFTINQKILKNWSNEEKKRNRRLLASPSSDKTMLDLSGSDIANISSSYPANDSILSQQQNGNNKHSITNRQTSSNSQQLQSILKKNVDVWKQGNFSSKEMLGQHRSPKQQHQSRFYETHVQQNRQQPLFLSKIENAQFIDEGENSSSPINNFSAMAPLRTSTPKDTLETQYRLPLHIATSAFDADGYGGATSSAPQPYTSIASLSSSARGAFNTNINRQQHVISPEPRMLIQNHQINGSRQLASDTMLRSSNLQSRAYFHQNIGGGVASSQNDSAATRLIPYRSRGGTTPSFSQQQNGSLSHLTHGGGSVAGSTLELTEFASVRRRRLEADIGGARSPVMPSAHLVRSVSPPMHFPASKTTPIGGNIQSNSFSYSSVNNLATASPSSQLLMRNYSNPLSNNYNKIIEETPDNNIQNNQQKPSISSKHTYLEENELDETIPKTSINKINKLLRIDLCKVVKTSCKLDVGVATDSKTNLPKKTRLKEASTSPEPIIPPTSKFKELPFSSFIKFNSIGVDTTEIEELEEEIKNSLKKPPPQPPPKPSRPDLEEELRRRRQAERLASLVTEFQYCLGHEPEHLPCQEPPLFDKIQKVDKSVEAINLLIPTISKTTATTSTTDLTFSINVGVGTLQPEMLETSMETETIKKLKEKRKRLSIERSTETDDEESPDQFIMITCNKCEQRSSIATDEVFEKIVDETILQVSDVVQQQNNNKQQFSEQHSSGEILEVLQEEPELALATSSRKEANDRGNERRSKFINTSIANFEEVDIEREKRSFSEPVSVVVQELKGPISAVFEDIVPSPIPVVHSLHRNCNELFSVDMTDFVSIFTKDENKEENNEFVELIPKIEETKTFKHYLKTIGSKTKLLSKSSEFRSISLLNEDIVYLNKMEKTQNEQQKHLELKHFEESKQQLNEEKHLENTQHLEKQLYEHVKQEQQKQIISEVSLQHLQHQEKHSEQKQVENIQQPLHEHLNSEHFSEQQNVKQTNSEMSQQHLEQEKHSEKHSEKQSEHFQLTQEKHLENTQHLQQKQSEQTNQQQIQKHVVSSSPMSSDEGLAEEEEEMFDEFGGQEIDLQLPLDIDADRFSIDTDVQTVIYVEQDGGISGYPQTRSSSSASTKTPNTGDNLTTNTANIAAAANFPSFRKALKETINLKKNVVSSSSSTPSTSTTSPPDPIPARIPRPKIARYSPNVAHAETPDEEAEAADRLTPLRSEMRSLSSGGWGGGSSSPRMSQRSLIFRTHVGDTLEEEDDEYLDNFQGGYAQHEWLKMATKKNTNAEAVEQFIDALESYSTQLMDTVINMTDQNGNTALHYAVSNENFDVISVLLDSKVCRIDQMNTAGYSTLMLGALCELRNETESAIMQRLFHMGNVNAKAVKHAQTALMLAASHGRNEATNLLLKCGADVNIQVECS
uniref:ANK_REP_REGION domain-containing protein n=1 Tax=Meloidogyne javanica TaxID=6303 RepID=A0A915LU92_MELJA